MDNICNLGGVLQSPSNRTTNLTLTSAQTKTNRNLKPNHGVSTPDPPIMSRGAYPNML